MEKITVLFFPVPYPLRVASNNPSTLLNKTLPEPISSAGDTCGRWAFLNNTFFCPEIPDGKQNYSCFY